MWNEERLTVNGCSIRMRRAVPLAGSFAGSFADPSAGSSAVANPSLLYLHGANGVPQIPPFLNAFTDTCDVLVPEHPGFGESDDPDWLECMDDLAYFYLDVLDQLGLQQLHVIGSSLGGWLALEMAIRQPQRFQSLVLIGSAGLAVPRANAGNIFRWNPEDMVRNTFHGDSWADKALAQPADADIAAKNRHTITRLAWSPRLHHPMLHKRLHRLQMPVLLAWGDNDQIVPVAQAAEFQRFIPQAQLRTYANCGHLPQVEQQAAFTQDVQQFLQQQQRL